MLVPCRESGLNVGKRPGRRLFDFHWGATEKSSLQNALVSLMA